MKYSVYTGSILQICLLATVCTSNSIANAQEAKGTPSASKVPGPVKPTETANIIVPKLRLRGAEPFHIGGSVPKDFHKIIFTFSNWDKFPAKWFEPVPDSTKLPPIPCRQLPTKTRVFLILRSEDGNLSRCTPMNAKEDFYFLLEKDKPIPEFVYVEVTDRTNGLKFKSNLVSPSSGVVK